MPVRTCPLAHHTSMLAEAAVVLHQQSQRFVTLKISVQLPHSIQALLISLMMLSALSAFCHQTMTLESKH
jgi:hypothetical protein